MLWGLGEREDERERWKEIESKTKKQLAQKNSQVWKGARLCQQQPYLTPSPFPPQAPPVPQDPPFSSALSTTAHVKPGRQGKHGLVFMATAP
ncbi:hypothetical protein DPEC_G00014960 [Dallia pectoralis]|uniref:Uncharacterized protein n=1 Tax=Dallia pectoralis TaxID=75939 RepID=A0ACC2HMG4_DALPE|nr:hypothetical protein DPEC_G00014960 [Dallia pectoralis]